MHKITSKRVVDVSILTANFNNGPFLRDYFQSILNSNVLPREIVFVDDGSTDESLDVLEEFKSLESLKLITLKSNTGFANALNRGIKEVSTKYIMRLDPDDFIDPQRVELQYSSLESNREIDILGSNVYYYNNKLKKVIGKSNLPCTTEKIRNTYTSANHGMFHTAVTAKVDVFFRLKYRQDFYPAEDYDFFSRALLNGYKLLNTNECLSYYRVHRNNLSDKYLKDSIQQIKRAHREIFPDNKRKISFGMIYLHRLNYRKSLGASNLLSRILYLFMAGLFNPRSILRRL